MRFAMKQKMWSFGGSYEITDGRVPIYRVEGRAFSWGNKLHVLDGASGGEVAFIEQKLLSMTPTYHLYRNGQRFAEIRKDLTFFRDQYTLDVPGPNDYTITGNLFDYEYTFTRGGQVVASVSKALWSWTDTYGVEVLDGEDDVSILATVVVIDLCHEGD